MKNELTKDFWEERYLNQQTGWDIGDVSAPLKTYFDQLKDKSLRILIPGCGNAYEAEYLYRNGFKNVYVLDYVQIPLEKLHERCGFSKKNMFVEDFFLHKGQYDLIIEQTMFCAIDPDRRGDYAKKVDELLLQSGKLVGLFFNCDFEGGPPFGGTKEEYLEYFKPYFSKIKMEECYNSIPPRKGRELFIILEK